MDIVNEHMLLIVGVVAVGGASFSGWWFFRHRKKGKPKPIVQAERPAIEAEDDEERVIRLLRASRGSLYQATITERCGFSKTKTSLLLTTMERKGIVRRKKKGRNKLVTLIENASLQPETTDEP